MFSDDEDELELLRQYGDRDLHGDEDEGHSSDDMDSDLEDKIMSMVQFKKKTPLTEKHEEPKIIFAPVEKKEEEETKPTKFSASKELQIIDDSDTEDIGVLEDPPTPQNEEELPVTRYINFDEKKYMDEEETDEEEAELNSKLQDLIDDQISKRQNTIRLTRPIRVCFGCNQPGHERKDCKWCADCGAKRHAESRCVGTRYCDRCKMRGHNQSDCQNPRERGPCKICQTPYHNALNCPSLLHVYENEGPLRKKPVPYCYYCTERGHYGDECSMLPKYLSTMPSAFSYYSLYEGTRFDPKKTMKSSGSGSYGSSSSHQRWSDQSRESSPRSDDRRGGGSGGGGGGGYKKRRYDEYQERDYYNNKPRYDDNERYNKKKNYKATSYKDNNAGGKRHRTDLVQENNRNGLDYIFIDERKKSNYNYAGKSGNNNWKAVNNNSLPQPTRSGTVNLTKKQRQQQQEQQNYGDFPRSNNNNGSDLPRPSSSGIIDLTQNDNSGGYSKRAPKYHGGYNRR